MITAAAKGAAAPRATAGARKGKGSISTAPAPPGSGIDRCGTGQKLQEDLSGLYLLVQTWTFPLEDQFLSIDFQTAAASTTLNL